MRSRLARDTTEFAKYHESHFFPDHVLPPFILKDYRRKVLVTPVSRIQPIGTKYQVIPQGEASFLRVACAPLQWAKLRIIWHLIPAGCSSPPRTRVATSARIRTLQSYRYKSFPHVGCLARSARDSLLSLSQQIENFRMSTRISHLATS